MSPCQDSTVLPISHYVGRLCDPVAKAAGAWRKEPKQVEVDFRVLVPVSSSASHLHGQSPRKGVLYHTSTARRALLSPEETLFWVWAVPGTWVFPGETWGWSRELSPFSRHLWDLVSRKASTEPACVLLST